MSSTLTITYHPSDAALANQIQADAERLPGGADMLIAVLSPLAINDPNVQRAINEALDRSRAVVPVLAQPTRLPKLIEHLEPIDFTQDYDFHALAKRLAQEIDSAALHLRVRTPGVRQSNRRTGYIVAAVAIIMFLVGLYGVGVLGIQRPADEYNAVETAVVLTRDHYIDLALPRSTEDAANFQVTVNAAAPTLRPLLIATATALASGQIEGTPEPTNTGQ